MTSTVQKASNDRAVPWWQRWLGGVGALSAGFTAMCCLGIAAAVSLASAVGATFLLRDETLRPLLAATIALSVLGSAFTYWRHRHPGPLVLTLAAGVHVYWQIYGRGASHSFGGGRLVAVWVGLAVLVAAQLWDLIRVRSRHGDASAAT